MAADYERLLQLSGELEQKEAELEQLLEEWEQVQAELLERDADSESYPHGLSARPADRKI